MLPSGAGIPVATRVDAITALNALNRAGTKDTFVQAAKEGDAKEYAELRSKLLTKATSFQKKALHAPLVYGDAPVCETCGTAAAPSPAEAKIGKPGTYWWCETCQTTQGARSPPVAPHGIRSRRPIILGRDGGPLFATTPAIGRRCP
ncbi:hypothetical protein [Streptomyces sp. NPDC054887]